MWSIAVPKGTGGRGVDVSVPGEVHEVGDECRHLLELGQHVLVDLELWVKGRGFVV